MENLKSKKYLKVTEANRRLYGWVSWCNYDDLTSEIAFIHYLKHERDRQTHVGLTNGGILSIVAGGFIGYFITEWLNIGTKKASFNVYFNDGTYIHITTGNKSLVMLLTDLMEEGVKYDVAGARLR